MKTNHYFLSCLFIALNMAAFAVPSHAEPNPGDILVLDFRFGGFSSGDDQGALFLVDPATGARTIVSNFTDGTQGPLGEGPTGLALDASNNVFVIDRNVGQDSRGALFSVDPATGVRTLLSDFGDSAQGPLGVDPQELTLDAAPGNVLVIDSAAGTDTRGALFRVDLATGTRMLLSDFGDDAQGPLGLEPFDVTLDASGNALVTDGDREASAGFHGALFSVNPSTGVRTIVSDFANPAQGPIGEHPFSVTLDASGNALVLNRDDVTTTDPGELFSVNPSTGIRTIVSDFDDNAQGPPGTSPSGLTVDAFDNVLVVDSEAATGGSGVLFSVNPSTGVRTIVSDFGDHDQGPTGLFLVDVAVFSDSAPLPTPGRLQFSVANYAAEESDVTATISVTRTGGTEGMVSADFATSDGSATSGSDYTFTDGTVNFGDGDATPQTFDVTLLDDSDPEGAETVDLSLTNPQGGATLGTRDSATLTIAASDAEGSPGNLQFTMSDYSVGEGDSTATISVVRSGGSDGTVSVDYATVAGGTASAGNDYNAASGTVTFGPEETTPTSFSVSIHEDALDEGAETVHLTLSNPQGGGSVGQRDSATLTIIDNDAPPDPEDETCGDLEATIVGTASDDVIRGTPGPDVIQGLGGNDKIHGMGGDDVMCGGEGKDVIRGAGQNDLIFGGAGDDRLFGGGGQDRIFGDEGKDKIRGGGDDDELSGGADMDRLFGEHGNDGLDGGAGNDRCVGGAGNGDSAANCEKTASVP